MKKALLLSVPLLAVLFFALVQAQVKNYPSEMEDLKKLELETLGKMQYEQQKYKDLEHGRKKEELDKRTADFKKQERNVQQDLEKLRSDRATFKDNKEEARKELTKHGDLSAAYVARGCKPNERTTDRALAQDCNRIADETHAIKIDLENKVPKLQAEEQRLAKEDERIKGILSGATKKKLSDDTMAWFAQKKACGAEFERLKAKLNDCHIQMDRLCKKILLSMPGSGCEGKECERLKHQCGNIQFDGANPNLPALEDIGIKQGSRFFGN